MFSKLTTATIPPSPFAQLAEMIREQAERERSTPPTTETEKDNGQAADQHADDDAAD